MGLNKEQIEIYDEIEQTRKDLYKNPKLDTLFFELTDECNLACLHCGSSCSPEKRTMLPKEYIFKTLKEVKDAYGSEIFIALTGGEPLLHPDFFEIVDKINELGFSWGITTNGTLIDEEMAKKLENHHMGSISISLDGLKEEHNKLRRNSFAFDKAVKGIQNVVQYTKAISMVTTVVSKLNIHSLQAIYDFVLTLNVNHLRLINIEPIGRAKDEKEYLLDYQEMDELLEFIRIHRVNKDNKMQVTYGCSHYVDMYETLVRDNYFFCTAGLSVASITAEGNIVACLNIDRYPILNQGNVKEDSFVKVWENEFKVYRKDRSAQCGECKKCNYRLACKGDSAHTWDFMLNEPRYCLRMLEKDYCNKIQDLTIEKLIDNPNALEDIFSDDSNNVKNYGLLMKSKMIYPDLTKKRSTKTFYYTCLYGPYRLYQEDLNVKENEFIGKETLKEKDNDNKPIMKKEKKAKKKPNIKPMLRLYGPPISRRIIKKTKKHRRIKQNFD